MLKELDIQDLKRQYNAAELGIQSTAEVEKLNSIIGQKRAISSLEFGLQIQGIGYNIYVAGPPGIGKMTSVKSYLQQIAEKKERPPDWCYVNNFNDAYEPRMLQLPAGKGCEFAKDMDGLISHVSSELPKAFESEKYHAQRNRVLESIKKDSNHISQAVDKKAAESGFSIQTSPMGILLIPVKDNKPLTEEEMQNLSQEEREELKNRQIQLQEEIDSAMKKMRHLEKKTQEKIKDLDKVVTLNIVGVLLEDLVEKYREFAKIVKHLNDVQEDIIDNIDSFKSKSEAESSAMPMPVGKASLDGQNIIFRKYKVNVIVDNSQQEGAPVIEELNPTFNNLIGRIEKEMLHGALTTDFTLIKAGALLLANGGFLILPIEDLLRNINSYEALKRAIRSCRIQVEELGESLGYMSMKSLRPEPIPLDVKVLLVGSPKYYYLLQAHDEDFPELFKVKADYDTRVDNSKENIRNFVSFLATYCDRKNIKHLDNDAISRVLEYAARVAGDRDKLSMKFGQITNLLHEANYWAGQNENGLISGKHIKKALEEKIYRSNIIQKHVQEIIRDGMILIDTSGEVVGQVNGLSVLDLGDYMFGKPSRITATVAPGRDGVVDIEREVKLGGPIHSKGVLIISGYLAMKYAKGRPLSLAARLVFEQSYEGVEGDSASSAELYAIVSALSGMPIKQNIAVTGSVNQLGTVQAIGGVNEKIEGFFDICREIGLTGEQGVIIPKSNVRNLMLRDDVIQAVDEKKFHIWSVETIDQGIEILTGTPAGERDGGGRYPEQSVNEKARMRLREFEEVLREMRYGKSLNSHRVAKSSS